MARSAGQYQLHSYVEESALFPCPATPGSPEKEQTTICRCSQHQEGRDYEHLRGPAFAWYSEEEEEEEVEEEDEEEAFLET